MVVRGHTIKHQDFKNAQKELKTGHPDFLSTILHSISPEHSILPVGTGRLSFLAVSTWTSTWISPDTLFFISEQNTDLNGSQTFLLDIGFLPTITSPYFYSTAINCHQRTVIAP
jgi:hypothetical protein